MKQCKSFEIPKELVWKSYQQVRMNGGAPGSDKVTIKEFDGKRNKNLYKIWNRLCSGSYFPPAILEKEIPKMDGSTRKLGIPTVSDRIAQGAVKIYLESLVEPLFHEDSFGYRPKKSAHQAIEKTWFRCHKSFWVLEVDIKGFFDNVSHELVLKALKHLNVPRWVELYCKRWLEAPMMLRNGKIVSRRKGTPQGGVISPLLANLFLHYAFDMWMQRTHSSKEFARYADDIIAHCKSYREALALKEEISNRLKEVGLELNQKKSNVIYLGTYQRRNVATEFTFLGFDFQYRTLKDSRDDSLFRKIAPGASKAAMRKIVSTIKGWRIDRATVEGLADFARRYNATIRGWIAYFDKFWYRIFAYVLFTTLQSRLLKWAKAKFRIGNKRATRYLTIIRREQPRLFPHWYLLQKQE